MVRVRAIGSRGKTRVQNAMGLRFRGHSPGGLDEAIARAGASGIGAVAG